MSIHLVLRVNTMIYIIMGISYCTLRYLEDTIHSGSYTTEAHMPLSSVQQFIN